MEQGMLRDAWEVAVQWEAVARMMQYRIRRDAQRKRQMVFYIQAIDVSKDKLGAEDYKKMLELTNYNDAGHAMGMMGVYVGMRVRLDRKISQKHGLVQGAEGEVVGLVFNAKMPPNSCPLFAVASTVHAAPKTAASTSKPLML